MRQELSTQSNTAFICDVIPQSERMTYICITFSITSPLELIPIFRIDLVRTRPCRSGVILKTYESTISLGKMQRMNHTSSELSVTWPIVQLDTALFAQNYTNQERYF